MVIDIAGARARARAGLASLRPHWPLVVALVVFVASVAYVLGRFLADTGSREIVYCLDDAYIHLAMAKTLATHAVYGIDPHGFSSATSSPLWVLLLSGLFLVFGATEIPPLILNVLFGIGLLVAVAAVLRRHAVAPGLALLVLLLTIYYAPILPVAFCGMEHVLHAFLTVVFLACAIEVLAHRDRRSPMVVLFVLAPLLAMVRYESLFALGLVSVLLLLQRRVRPALALASAGVAPLVVFGLLSLEQGAYALPNSALLKADATSIRSWLDVVGLVSGGFERLTSHRVLGRLWISALVISGLTYWRTRRLRYAHLLALFAGMSLLHAQLALFGWFYRYEAYLVVLGLAVVAVALTEAMAWASHFAGGRARAVKIVSLVALAVYLGDGLGIRVRRSVESTPAAMRNIYEQQVQMGRFVREFYSGEWIAANDIGAISFLSDARLLDLQGLASVEVLRLLRAGRLNPHEVARLANERQVKMAVVYESPILPEHWIRVARWAIRDNVVCASDTVSFYATTPAEAARLRSHLTAFARRLPPRVDLILDPSQEPSPRAALPRGPETPTEPSRSASAL